VSLGRTFADEDTGVLFCEPSPTSAAGTWAAQDRGDDYCVAYDGGIEIIERDISAGEGGHMKKSDLVNEVAKVVANKREAKAAVETIFSSITKALKKKQSVTIVGFGTFKVVQRKARKGRNPQTGTALKIKAKKVPKFSSAKALISATGTHGDDDEPLEC
jgi:nucleoid DNA-binding protein